MEEEKYLVWISRIEGLGSIKIQRLLEKYKTLANMWNLEKQDLMKIEGIGEVLAQKILDKKYKLELEKYLNYMSKNNIKIIGYDNIYYPEKLKNIYDKPIVLYVKGNEKILNDFGIAIIGCRDSSDYGRKTAYKISNELAKKDINIISGMARGIDTYAHLGAVNANCKTISVVGCGLDTVYPAENRILQEKIIETGGAIVSEYVIGTKPEKSNFPARNRIISGLCNGLLVVEAKQKSGTLITVDFALEQGKDIFAIPRKY